MDKPKAVVVLDHFKELLGGRSNFDTFWQTLHNYFYIESPDISSSYAPGAELNADYLFDATTLESADILASGFMNYLTPPTSKWFKLRHKNPAYSENKPVTDYLEKVADEVYHTLNNSNFYDQILPAYKSSGVYGTSILLEEEDATDEARFFNMPIKQVCIAEDARGRIKEYYIEFEYTAWQAATRWGKEALSQSMQDEDESRKEDKKHKLLLFIGERSKRLIDKSDRSNMPLEALWIDVEAKKVIDEGGYHEFPAMAHRFDKRAFLPWGFSPAMKALPFARMLAAITKTSLRAFMKHTDPPIAIPNDCFIMPLNMNPRAVNAYKAEAMGQHGIMPFGNYGKLDAAQWSIEYYTKQVKSLMYNDVFLAFEGLDKQMNNPEVMERINEKMTMLGPAVGRFTAEVLNPIIIRTIGILHRRGKLPPPPDEIMNDPTYEIAYVSQLAQAQKRSEMNSLVTALTMTGQMAQYAPAVLDKVDHDKAVDEVWNVTGAPARVLRDDEEIGKIREQRAQEQAQAQEMAMAGALAQTGKDAASADKSMAEAKVVGKQK